MKRQLIDKINKCTNLSFPCSTVEYAMRNIIITNFLSRFGRVLYAIRCCSSVDENILFSTA